MTSACFDASAVSTAWKHAEGMSLRYGAVIFGDLTHPLQTQAPTRINYIISPTFPQQKGRTDIFCGFFISWKCGLIGVALVILCRGSRCAAR